MLIDKTKLPLVAEEFMNETHFEDVDIINDLYSLITTYENDASEENKNSLIEKYNFWTTHTINHFQTEEKKMNELRFPPYPIHKAEHDRCLETMSMVLENFKSSSDISKLKSYFENDLLIWLDNHIKTMDTVTAMFFKTGLSPCQSH